MGEQPKTTEPTDSTGGGGSSRAALLDRIDDNLTELFLVQRRVLRLVAGEAA